MDSKMESMKKAIIDNIQFLIDDNKLDQAMNLIKEYIKIDSQDIEIYSMKAIVLIMQGNIEEAKKVLKDGLVVDDKNFDLNYNLAYLCEQEKKFDEAVRYYRKALDKCRDENLKNDICSIIQKICSEYNIKFVEDKKKIAFFVKQGMDSFICDIITGLSEEYETNKIIVTEFSQIDEGMKWADICWFEWCDELVAYGSKHKLSNIKKIVCRLHRYEVFTNYPKNVEWNNVDKLIVVTEHLKKFLVSQINDIEKKVDIITINNGVDLNKYQFKERKQGFNIAYVGYIHQRKNPTLVLQIISKLVKIDNRYKLYIAGAFQDKLVELYWNYQVQQMGLQNNVIFQGWQKNIDKWLEDKNYILAASMHESFGYGIAEAMTRGIKPIIHNFIFAKEIWDDKYLFNTIDEAVNMIIANEYNSIEYRNIIEEKFTLNSQMLKIKVLLEDIINEKDILVKEKLTQRFLINPDDIKNTENLFNFLLENKMEQEYMEYISEWFIRSKYDLDSRFRFYYFNMYRNFNDYNRFQYIDNKAYESMEKIGKNILDKNFNKWFKNKHKTNNLKKKVLFISNGLDIKQIVVRFNYEYIISSKNDFFEYHVLSVLNKNEFNNYEESVSFLNSNNINYYIPNSNNIETKIEYMYDYINKLEPDIVIFQSFYFSPISVLLYPLFKKLNVIIGRFVHQQPECYFDEKIDFVISFFDYCIGLKYKDIFNMLLPVRSGKIDKELNIKNKFNIDKNKKIIISIGRDIKYQNKEFWEYVIRCSNEIKDICFVFFGFKYDNFKKWVPKYLVDNKIIVFAGYDLNALSYLKSCNCYLNSPLSGGVSFSEAYYAELPIITFFGNESKEYFSIDDIANTAARNYYSNPETIFPEPKNYEKLFDMTKNILKNDKLSLYIKKSRKLDKDKLRHKNYVEGLELFMANRLLKKTNYIKK